MLLGSLGSSARPALKQILFMKNDHGAGAVLPIGNPATDLAQTMSGVKCRNSGCAPEFVMVLACSPAGAQETPIGMGAEAMVEIIHDEVMSARTAPNDQKFRVEFLVPLVLKKSSLMEGDRD